ncbi:MAG TPA: hypothetical protein VKH62_08050 [Candidatus Binatia bacterium]|jgi:hypothetical protein|nr:hypothetical protein [Candidatus Binatia bacterium]
MFVVRIWLALAVLMPLSVSEEARALDDSWFFSAAEIQDAYRYQQLYGARLRRPLKATHCLYGRAEFAASFQTKKFTAPCKFITDTIRQLRELLESGAAKYLFPLDADHAHLGIPLALWDKKYSKLADDEIFPALLREASLVALYHTAEHLEPNAQAQVTNAKIWGANRSVLGFFDDRPNETLPPLADGSGVHEPMAYRWFHGFTFLAQSLGELQLVANGAAIPFDISFDDDLAADADSPALNIIATER